MRRSGTRRRSGRRRAPWRSATGSSTLSCRGNARIWASPGIDGPGVRSTGIRSPYQVRARGRRDLSLSETLSGWRLTENRAMQLFNEGSFEEQERMCGDDTVEAGHTGARLAHERAGDQALRLGASVRGAASSRRFLLLNGRLGMQPMLTGFFLPVLVGNIIGGTALFALIAYAQGRRYRINVPQ
jgi:hypothetical protein